MYVHSMAQQQSKCMESRSFSTNLRTKATKVQWTQKKILFSFFFLLKNDQFWKISILGRIVIKDVLLPSTKILYCICWLTKNCFTSLLNIFLNIYCLWKITWKKRSPDFLKFFFNSKRFRAPYALSIIPRQTVVQIYKR